MVEGVGQYGWEVAGDDDVHVRVAEVEEHF